MPPPATKRTSSATPLQNKPGFPHPFPNDPATPPSPPKRPGLATTLSSTTQTCYHHLLNDPGLPPPSPKRPSNATTASQTTLQN
ncbi:hypothetical protein QE152_g5879 [Popillia japonica]|uniref:Uncharacterized protein n=1 Tax=Popillia japonica TaxID=7064 RepID=A0AAW1MMA1_POPJA